MQEFIEHYCKDIVAEKERQKQLFDDEPFPFEDIVYDDDDGRPVKIVYGGQVEIPIADILSMCREEFEKAYPTKDCLIAYDNYVENIIIIEGAEALNRIRNLINSEQDKIRDFKLIPKDII